MQSISIFADDAISSTQSASKSAKTFLCNCIVSSIRFVDFIEDALERATYLDRIEEIVNDADRVKEKIADAQQISVRYGFKRGVLAALLALDGQLGLSRNLIPDAVRSKPPFKTVSGGQLKLFD